MARHITLLGKDPQTLNTNSPKGSLFQVFTGVTKTVEQTA